MTYKLHKQYRLPGYDYSANGAYFITIVTKNRIKHFGKIENGEMHLSEKGKFVEENFKQIAAQVSKIKIPVYSIMPEHIHLIVAIETEKIKPDDHFITGMHPLTKDSVSSFINHFKGTIKKWCNKNGYAGFAWQHKYHDRIIRDEHEYERIARYIENNVINS